MALCLLRSRGEELSGGIHFLLRTLSSRAESPGPRSVARGSGSQASRPPGVDLHPVLLARQPQREPRPLGCPHLLVTFDLALPQEESASRGTLCSL